MPRLSQSPLREALDDFRSLSVEEFLDRYATVPAKRIVNGHGSDMSPTPERHSVNVPG